VTPAHAANAIAVLCIFALILLEMHRRKPSSGFCPRCGNPERMHKIDCSERR